MSLIKIPLIQRFSYLLLVGVILSTPLIALFPSSPAKAVSNNWGSDSYGALYYDATSTGLIEICNNSIAEGVAAPVKGTDGNPLCWVGAGPDGTPNVFPNSHFGFVSTQTGMDFVNISVDGCSQNESSAVVSLADGSNATNVSITGLGPTDGNAAQQTIINDNNTSGTPVQCNTGPGSAANQVINVNINYSGLGTDVTAGGGNDTLGPTPIILCTSISYCSNPQSVDYQSVQSSTATITKATAVLTGQFTGVAAGPWTVCIADITASPCQTITKVTGKALTLNFTGTAADASTLLNLNDQQGSTLPSCESSGFSLSWIMCPLIEGLAKATDGIYSDLVQPLLKTPPVVINQPANCTVTGSQAPPAGCDVAKTYQVWSDFRTYGDIFLVLALLGLVFGEIIGGGIIQAYTAKKMLPRILLAVVLINLSIYFVAALLDITNVLGSGLSDLITAPFSSAGAFYIHLNGGASGIGLFGFVGAAGAGIWALTLGPELIIMFLLFVLLPALFAMLAVLFTVIIRQGIIIFLVISSPLAFALYVLPNTEQYFKKWWHLLFTTLLVYPIIAVIFALANVLSVTLSDGAYQQNGGAATISQLVAMVAIVMPLFLIPFAFKMAGGIMGSIYGGLSSLGKKAVSGIQGDPRNENSLQNRWRNRARELGAKRGVSLRAYLGAKTTGEGSIDQSTRTGRFKHRVASRALNTLPDYARRMSDSNRKWKESIGGKDAAGDDTLELAYFAKKVDEDTDYTDASGNIQTLKKGHFYSQARDSEGKYKEYAAGDVAKSHGMYDGNASKIQYLMEYASGKVASDEEFYGVDADNNILYDPSKANEVDRTRMPMGSFMSNVPETLRNAKLGSTPARGAAIGTFFATANARRELKHTKMKADLSGWAPRDTPAFINEHAEVMSAYATANSKPSEVKALTYDYQALEQKRVAAQKGGPRLSSTEVRAYKQLQQIAPSYDEQLRNSMMQQRGKNGEIIVSSDQTVVSVGDDGAPVTSGALAGSGAPVMTAQAMQELVDYHRSLGKVDIDAEYPEYQLKREFPVRPAPPKPEDGDDTPPDDSPEPPSGPPSGPRPPSRPPSTGPDLPGGPLRRSRQGSSRVEDGTININHDTDTPLSTQETSEAIPPSSETKARPNRQQPKVISPKNLRNIPTPVRVSAGPTSTASVPPSSSSTQNGTPQQNIEPENTSRLELSSDIIDLDKNGNPHREDGKTMDRDQAEIAQSNADLIRGGLAERAKTPRPDNLQYVVPSPDIDHQGVSHVELSPDIMRLDKNGNPHRPDGTMMSNEEAEIAQSNADLIRGGLADRTENDNNETDKT